MSGEILNKLLPFLISALLGLAIGIERERRQAEFRTMGVRTFVLLGLLGALTGVLQNLLLQAVIGVFIGAAIIIGYIRATTAVPHHKKIDIGLTTEVAACATFLLGLLSNHEPFLSVFLGLLVLTVLLSREFLHRFAKEQIKTNEIQAAVILLVLILAILPLIPDKSFDPWGVFNLKQVFVVIVILLGIQFLSYVAVRIFGAKIGLSLAGFLSGFVSSTLAFLSLPELSKRNKTLAYCTAASAIFAAVAALILLCILVMALSFTASAEILPAVIPTLLTGCGFAYFYARKTIHDVDFPLIRNPLSVKPALRLGFIFFFVMIIIVLVQKWFGNEMLEIVSFVGGLFELHSVAISVISLFSEHKIDLELMKKSVFIAIAASIISKLIITWIVARHKYLWLVSFAMSTMLAVFLMSWYFF